MSRQKIFRRSPESAIGFSLFPFLTVLLCTMGSLIMLLVLTTRNVREQNAPLAAAQQAAESVAVEQTEKQLQTLNTEIEDTDWLAEELTKSKKLAEDKLVDERAKLAAVEKETQKIKEELKRLETIVKELDANTTATPQERDELKRLLEQKKALRLQGEAELEKLQDEANRNSKSYAIIPYPGTSGTFRRPIYIECSKNTMIIQPEGVVLFGIDFQAPERVDNPVDAALRVVRQYFMETNQLPKGTEPYPLLIVRPSGVDVYGAARASMGSWINEYGYELVDEDWNVEYPPPNRELKERIEKQLEVARDRTAAYLAAVEMQRKTAERTQQFRVDSKGLVQRIEPSGGFSSTLGRPPSSESMLSAERNAPYGSPYTAQPSFTTGETQKKEDDLISLEVPDPSKKEKPMRYPASTESQSRPSETNPMEQDASPSTPGGSPNHSAGQSTPPTPPGQPGQPGQPGGQPVVGMKGSPNDSRDENWALKGARRNAIGVTRNIKIQIEEERLVLIQQPGLMFAQVVLIGPSIALATDNMVGVINEFTESWGIAGENMYWKPTLKVNVLPGAEENFNDFQLLLRGSGMIIEKSR